MGKGVYHKVRAGETIWRIAKAYHVSVDDIIRTNKIPNVALIERNQLVFIPGAGAVKEIDLDQGPKGKEFIWPLRGKIISYFGKNRNLGTNNGIDILAKEGQKVRAARNGKVIFADYLNGYANTVIVDHGDGFFSVYAQNLVLLVKNGETVSRGSPIAKVGRRGSRAFLHFEIRKQDIPTNPLYYLP